MTNKRLFWLILLMAGLGVLVWLDNQQDGGKVSSDQVSGTGLKAPASGQKRKGKNISEAALATKDQPLASNNKPNANPLSGFDKEKLSNTISRPLFAPKRSLRPPPKTIKHAPVQRVETEPRTKNETLNYTLVGVVNDGERAVALLRDKNNGASFRVETGDMIGGWRIIDVEPKSVLLKSTNNTSRTVTIFKD